jgi:hypothetical protein
MHDRLILPEEVLAQYLSGDDWADRARGLLQQQKETWELLRKGYASLESVETKIFEIDNSVVKVQFNPGRLTSSAAKVDEKSIKERKCFLCPQNLPDGQRGLRYTNDYILLCNPFPILPEHFTIPRTEHIPQQIHGTFGILLDLSCLLQKYYSVFYNGPRCGASAPDHLHFQAGSRSVMPIEDEYAGLKKNVCEPLLETEKLRAYSAGRFLRRFISFESPDRGTLLRAFGIFYNVFADVSGHEEEPMMNILSLYEHGAWRVMVFPRSKHRPSHFYAKGDAQMLLSPAVVDVGGVCTTPIEKDFRRMTREIMVQMLEEVMLGAEPFDLLRQSLAEALREVGKQPQ